MANTTLRHASDLKVGEWIRSLINQCTYEVTEVQARAVYVRQVQGNTKTTSVIPERILFNYVRVDKQTGQLSPPVKRTDSVRLHYKVTAGVLAAFDVMADRQDTPEETAKAVAKGFKEPYMVSLRRLVRVKIDTPWANLTTKQAKMIEDAVARVEDVVSAGRDREVVDAYDLAIVNATKAANAQTSLPLAAPSHPARGTDATLDSDTAPLASAGKARLTGMKEGKVAAPTLTARERRKPRFTETT